MSKATPRQWRQANGSKEVILDEKDRMLGEMITEANAELIVRAVNCHDELVEIVEQYLKDYSKEQWNQVGGDEYQIKLENLLKRARGE